MRSFSWLVLPLLGVLALVAVACGDNGDGPSAPTTAPTSGSETTEASPTGEADVETNNPGDGVFPVTVEHMFGSSTVESEPERVMTIGFSEQDPVLALGIVPIAVREWFGEQPYAIWPWALDELGDGTPDVLNMPFGEIDYEEVAALDPDVIVGTHSGMTADEYERLSQIAPTIAQSGDYPPFGMPWQEQARLIGQALGRADEADALVAGVESAIEAAGEEHPEFEGKTIAWLLPTADGEYSATGPTTPPMRFLATLGLEMPEELAAAIGDASGLPLSAEQIGMVDADIIIIRVNDAEQREAVVSDPLFSQLPAAQNDHLIVFEGLTDPLYGALSFSTVLSLQYALDELVPQLAELAGDVE